MKYICPKCYQKVEGRRETCAIDNNEYINLDAHYDLKDNQCLPWPYNIVTGARRPIRGPGIAGTSTGDGIN